MQRTSQRFATPCCRQGTDIGSEKTIIERSGTYAYAPQTGSTADCPAAVSYWKKAYVNLGDLPPEYEGNTGVYEDSRNRSLVALYNPNKGATVDCAYITCPVSPTSTTTVATSAGPTDEDEEEDDGAPQSGTVHSSDEREAAGSAGSGDQPKTGPTVRRLSTPSETVTGLVCLTNPAALENGKKPFSEEVWEDIQEAIENSASASTQSALLATGLILFTSSIIL
ncbi:SAG family member [Eimeria mitis]|uniref:SAG family member n=1 Tax=Eimeria mitis TaxID=44415 RepID=U6JSN2_9EIME|nr:SAG family member [Eimeria mitis]CDJ27816.1 SAG family member [Eimeria mitis]